MGADSRPWEETHTKYIKVKNNADVNGNLSVANEISGNTIAIANAATVGSLTTTGTILGGAISGTSLSTTGDLWVLGNIMTPLVPKPATLGNGSVTPSPDLGTQSQRWNTVYADNIDVYDDITARGAISGGAISGTSLSTTGTISGGAISGSSLSTTGAISGGVISGTSISSTGAISGTSILSTGTI